MWSIRTVLNGNHRLCINRVYEINSYSRLLFKHFKFLKKIVYTGHALEQNRKWGENIKKTKKKLKKILIYWFDNQILISLDLMACGTDLCEVQ